MIEEDAVLAIANKYLRKIQGSGPGQIMAECPFHTSDKPGGSRTLSLSLSQGVFFCFSCHTKGNLETFLRLIGEEPEVVRLRHGPLLERLRAHQPPAYDPIKGSTHSMGVLPEALLGLFRWCPTDLLDVGFTEDTLLYFEVGFDKTHMRITYPLRDIQGRLVGVSGRSVEETGDGRYKLYKEEYKSWGLPSTNTERRFLLWNFHKAIPALGGNKNPLVITEGFKACMWVHQCGIPAVVAAIGSNLTDVQLHHLSNVGRRSVLMFDGDKAGLGGTLSSGRKLAQTTEVRVAEIPYGQQPDQLTPEQVQGAVQSAMPFELWATRRRRYGN